MQKHLPRRDGAKGQTPVSTAHGMLSLRSNAGSYSGHQILIFTSRLYASKKCCFTYVEPFLFLFIFLNPEISNSQTLANC